MQTNWLKYCQENHDPASSQDNPSSDTIDGSNRNFLFHGTAEPVQGDLKSMSVGNILWVADAPAIAQNYIRPDSSMRFCETDFPDNQTFYPRLGRPDAGFEKDMYYQMVRDGFAYPVSELTYDKHNNVQGFSIDKGGFVLKNHHVKQYLKNHLGYTKTDGCFKVKYQIVDRHYVFQPANWNKGGSLYVLVGRENLRICDLVGLENDLMSPIYNRIDLFMLAREQGYDAIKIQDYAQSGVWGNVGHDAIGIFPEGLKKLKIIGPIKAQHFDWKDNLKLMETPEFNAWLRDNKPV